MARRNWRWLVVAGAALCGLVSTSVLAQAPPDTEALERSLADTERAFAKTMADRDHAAFAGFLAKEAVFFTGQKPLRGAEAVAAWWKRYYEGPDAPFSWEPEKVEVLDSGTLALSTGPVRDPAGNVVATFTSIWRREAGRWRIVFDKGNEACPKKP